LRHTTMEKLGQRVLTTSQGLTYSYHRGELSNVDSN
jgi:hypothetical protein